MSDALKDLLPLLRDNDSGGVIIQDHPVATLSRADPERGERILEKMLNVKLREINAHLAIARIQNDRAEFAELGSTIRSSIKTHPECKNHMSSLGKGLFAKKWIRCKSW